MLTALLVARIRASRRSDRFRDVEGEQLKEHDAALSSTSRTITPHEHSLLKAIDFACCIATRTATRTARRIIDIVMVQSGAGTLIMVDDDRQARTNNGDG